MITAMLLALQLVLSAPDTLGLPSGKGKNDSPIVFTEMSVVGVRADEKTPISQKTLDKAEIQQSNFGQEMPYQLSKLPAMQYQSDGGAYTGYSYMRLRGIDQTRINFTLNGMPLNEPEDQGAYFSNYVDFMSSVQSVQIQRGIGTSTNGVASYGGSVNFQLHSLNDSIGTIEYGMGSYNTKRLSLSYTSINSNNLALYVRASQLSSDEYRYNAGNKSKSVYFSFGYSDKKEIFQLTTFIGDEQCSMAYLAASLDDIRNDPKTNYLGKDEKDHFTQIVSQLQYIYLFNSHISLSTQLYMNVLNGNYTVRFGDLFRYGVGSDWIGLISNLNLAYDNIKIYSGIHLYTYNRSHYSDLNPLDFKRRSATNYLYYNTGYKNEESFFTKVSYDVNKLTVFGDVQYRRVQFDYIPVVNSISINPIAWSFVNPRIGVNYSVSDNVALYSSIGLMHREPTRNDMFAGNDNIDSSNASSIGDLHKVKPEQVTDIEIGMNIKANNLIIQADVYNMQFTNEIAAIGVLSPPAFLPLRKNVPSSYRRGFEVDAQYNITRNLKFESNVSYIYAKIKEYKIDFDGVYYNITPLLTPHWISNSSISYSILPFELIANERVVSESYLDNQNTLTCPSYIVTDFATKYHVDDFDFTLRVNNLFDKRYYSGGYVTDAVPYYFVQADRNFFVGTSFSF